MDRWYNEESTTQEGIAGNDCMQRRDSFKLGRGVAGLWARASDSVRLLLPPRAPSGLRGLSMRRAKRKRSHSTGTGTERRSS